MKLKRLNLIFKIAFFVTLIIYGLITVAGPIMLANSSIVNSYLGIETEIGAGVGATGNTYFDTKYKNMEEVRQASLEIIEETMSEGAVLLKNESTLPLNQNDSVSLYGLGAYYPVYSGQGSSGPMPSAIKTADTVNFYNGLKNAGLTLNSDLGTWYSSQNVGTYMGSNDFSGAENQAAEYVVKDIAWSTLPSSKENNAKAAVVVLSRTGGEALDMYMDTTMDDGETRVVLKRNNNNNASASVGDALELTTAEKSVLTNLKALKGKGIDKIVVIMNSASPLQCEFMNDPSYGIDAALWVGTVGTNGANAVGKLLTGEYNPSGRLSDTFFANSKYNPVYYNFGSMEYGNSGVLSSYYQTDNVSNNKYYVAYQEGIYNGYKYTETRYEDVLTNRAGAGEFNYETVVSYPFGFGLSYTNFTYSNLKVSKNNSNNTYSITVDVKNNTALEGKEVVQIYLQKPYTARDIANGIEKAAVELVGFDKVTVPANGTATAKIIVEEKYFAAYDSHVENTYVIGSDDKNDEYLLTAAKDAHDAINNILQYKSGKGVQVDVNNIVSGEGRDNGNKELVWGTHISYDAKKYSTNAFIESENAAFENISHYDGQEANFGVNKITNQFEDVDFQKSNLFTEAEKSQPYMTRSNWEGTYGKRIMLEATAALKSAQKIAPVEQDDIEYPTYEEDSFYESEEVFDDMKLIYLRGKDYNDPDWDKLLDKMSYEETAKLLQTGLRGTNSVESIATPSTSQQNGAVAPVHNRDYSQLPSQSAFKGFAAQLDEEHTNQDPPVFVCNGIVSSTYNSDLIERVGEQTGEEAAWAGFNGIYGLGVNIHRGAYCGRTFEYYSEDGFLTGIAAGYEAVGLHKMGVFVLMKHAVLNDQETHRAGINVWADEQTIREIYCRAIEVAVSIDRTYTRNTVLGVMTGMNRLGATWTGGQGFCNTVLKAEFGMRGYVISDYNSARNYMSPIQGVLNGNDLPDGEVATTGTWASGDSDGNEAQFLAYKQAEGNNYGQLAWAMRAAAKSILYTVVNSNAMNGIDGDSSFRTITPAWEIAIPVLTRVFMVLLIWSTLAFAVMWTLNLINEKYSFGKEVQGSGEPEDGTAEEHSPDNN